MPESSRVKRSNTAHGTCYNRTDGNGRQPGRYDGIMRKNYHLYSHFVGQFSYFPHVGVSAASSRCLQHGWEFARRRLSYATTAPISTSRRAARNGRDTGARAASALSKATTALFRRRRATRFLDVTRYSFGRQ